MAKKKAPEDVTALVRALYARSGEPSQRQWAISAGLLEEQVSDYLNGYGISGSNLVKLMRSSGVLDELMSSAPAAPVAAARPVGTDPLPDGLQEGIAEAVAEQMQPLVETVAALTRSLEGVERLLAQREEQSKRAAN